jgi:cation transport ATPase
MALVVALPMADGKVLHVAVAAFAQGPDVFQRGIVHSHMFTAHPARHDAMQLACHRCVLKKLFCGPGHWRHDLRELRGPCGTRTAQSARRAGCHGEPGHRVGAHSPTQMPMADAARLRRAVRDAGYEPRAADATMRRRTPRPGPAFARWPSALALSAPLVLPMVGDLFGQHWMLPAWLQFVLATPVQFILGARFYKAGWHALQGAAAAIWTCWWPSAPPRAGPCRCGCG